MRKKTNYTNWMRDAYFSRICVRWRSFPALQPFPTPLLLHRCLCSLFAGELGVPAAAARGKRALEVLWPRGMRRGHGRAPPEQHAEGCVRAADGVSPCGGVLLMRCGLGWGVAALCMPEWRRSAPPHRTS
ncbi:crossover junction endonuclease MUS81 [Trypanosoma cruzi]|nr:crossover junction endonuclease MUS81 [Trypanosoma cruzi]